MPIFIDTHRETDIHTDIERERKREREREREMAMKNKEEVMEVET
jgi:hypothetical protein